jgi:ligand-binding SRPBCC domain-containing protein
MSTFRKRSLIACPAQELFDWHARPGAFDRLSPPWMSAQVIERSGGIEDGARLVMQVGPGPFGMRWVAEHRNYIAGQQFADVLTWLPGFEPEWQS